MITICWSAKGGSGTTVVATSLGLLANHSLLVDLAGDVATALGLDVGDRPGVLDWIGSDAPAEHLGDLTVEVGSDTLLLPQRPAQEQQRPSSRWDELGAWLRGWGRELDGTVVVDAGATPPPAGLLRHADRDLLVTRSCYLSLAAVRAMSHRPSGVVLLREPGRVLRARDVSSALQVPVVAELPYDTRVSRALDAGLLATRMPHSLRKAARQVAA